ncbi:MAG: hypothetical protein ACKOFF_04035 [Acidimicrobiales bacterium]
MTSTRRRTDRHLLRLLPVFIAVGMTAACSGNEAALPRPLTVDEASRLAGTMHGNHLAGSARFDVNTVDGPGGSALRLTGPIDWTNSTGAAAVSSAAAESTLVAVAWKGNAVLERRPVHDELLEGLGVSSPPWLARPIDPSRRIDQVISVVAGLATTQPENAILLQQKEGTAFLRSDTLRDIKVDVMRYGSRSIFWVDNETGQLLRFEGNTESGSQPVIVDFFPAAGASPGFPSAGQVVNTTGRPELAALLSGN